MNGYNNPVLLNALEKLKKHYDDARLEEVAINNPGTIWLKYRKDAGVRQGWVAVDDDALTYTYLERLCIKLANLSHQPFLNDNMPILSTTLPGGHRFQAIMGENVRYDSDDTHGVAISIRLFQQDKTVSLADFGLTEDDNSSSNILTEATPTQQEVYDTNVLRDLLTVIEKGEAILISGATSTGKTSFLNDLVEYIDQSKRIITVEDAREIILQHKNHVHLLVSRTEGLNKVGYPEILDAIVRMTPDVLIAGEISIKNAVAVHRLMTTGHTNFMATIHASSPENAIKAFYQNLAQSLPGIDAQAALDIIRSSFTRIVQIERKNNQRLVSAIQVPSLLDKLDLNDLKA